MGGSGRLSPCTLRDAPVSPRLLPWMKTLGTDDLPVNCEREVESTKRAEGRGRGIACPTPPPAKPPTI